MNNFRRFIPNKSRRKRSQQHESKGKFLEKGESRQVKQFEIERTQKVWGGSFPLLLRRKCITMILLFVSMLCFSPADLEVRKLKHGTDPRGFLLNITYSSSFSHNLTKEN